MMRWSTPRRRSSSSWRLDCLPMWPGHLLGRAFTQTVLTALSSALPKDANMAVMLTDP
jgi:hypothetical protein